MGLEPISKTIEAVIKGLTENRTIARQQAIYEALIFKLGEAEKEHLKPEGLRRGILTLLVDSPARMFDFNFKKKRILKELQDEFGQETIKDIKLRIGKIK